VPFLHHERKLGTGVIDQGEREAWKPVDEELETVGETGSVEPAGMWWRVDHARAVTEIELVGSPERFERIVVWSIHVGRPRSFSLTRKLVTGTMMRPRPRAQWTQAKRKVAMLRRVVYPVGLLAVVLLVGGCYHAIVETGRPASGTVVENKWANSFVYGLVPPKTVETMSQCPSGVSRVETQISFLNGLVGALTFQIYTPMTITVHCATAGGEDADASASVKVPAGATSEDVQAAFDRAAKISAQTGAAAWVVMDLE
jgi:Bor protein